MPGEHLNQHIPSKPKGKKPRTGCPFSVPRSSAIHTSLVQSRFDLVSLGMDLFNPIVPLDKQHANFARACITDRIGEREVVQGWASGFPDRDNKFVHEFQTTFNSSFWEVYLYALFKEYGFDMDWSKPSPDFSLATPLGDAIVEAVTANAAIGAVPEWEKPMMSDSVRNNNYWPLNREAIIRLSSALLSKKKKYDGSYKNLAHVSGKPYVIAVAPFEQPDFQLQYDRPMRALLYDDYVDEAAYRSNPRAYREGPPSVKLGFVEKDNGASIEMGIFLNDGWREVSAVLFSCVATWGKTVAMSNRPKLGFVTSVWGTDASGQPQPRNARIGYPSESISDGLQIFHNPHARRPLPLETFRRNGVVQHYYSPDLGWIREGYDNCLQFRSAHIINVRDDKSNQANAL